MTIRRTHSLHHLLFVVPIAATLTLAGTAGAGGSYDGTYRGRETVQMSNNTALCSGRNNVRLVIRNNHFTRRWYDTDIGVDVASDGTFSQSGSFMTGNRTMRSVTIRGKIIGTNLEADMSSGRCAMHLSLQKS
jgi:hypothetical protein